MRTKLLWVGLCLMLSLSCAFGASVEVFAPQGEVKKVRQVTARFSEPMVPFGDPRLLEPFEIDCPAKGSGRWADPKHWVFDFEQDLSAGIRCQFRLKGNIASDAGNAIAPSSFEFTTGGPAIVEQLPEEGSSIDEEQAFILGLDAQATTQSVQAHAWCDIKGIIEKVGVKIIEGKEREAILADQANFLDRVQSFLRRGSGVDRLQQGKEDLPVVVLRCQRRLPNGGEVKLVWGKGIAATSGVLTSQDQTLAFRVRPEFRASFSCERVNARAGCLPIVPMRLSFSAPVARKQAQLITLKDVGNHLYKISLPDSRESGDFVNGIQFDGPFPEQTQFKLDVPANIRDDAGRKLVNASSFPLSVKTDEAPPLAKFPSTFGVIESQVGAELPVSLRNIENPTLGKILKANPLPESLPGKALKIRTASASEIIDWLRKVDRATHDEWVHDPKRKEEVRVPAGSRSVFSAEDKTASLSVPKPEGPKAFEVIGIPLKESGLHIVEIASPKLGAALLVEPPKEGEKSKPGMAVVYYAPTAALVTNLSVHFKQGRESSLAWITRLDNGKPVAKAAVSVQDCAGQEYWKGTTDANGIARIKTELPDRRRLSSCLHEYDKQYVVLARSGNDMSFVLSDWNEGISRWRFRLPNADWTGPQVARTVLDRTLLRVGDTAHMKHFYRKRVGQGFAFIKSESLPASFKIHHRGSDQSYEIPVKWDGRDSAESEWKIPEGAKTGTYDIIFEDALKDSEQKTQRVAGTFRVEEFRVPTMRAFLQAPAEPQVDVDKVPLVVQVSYLSGGGAGNQTVKVRGVVQPRSVSFPAYEGFTWAAGKVQEGIHRPGTLSWRSGEYEMEEAEQEEGSSESSRESNGDTRQRRTLRQLSLTLDPAGAGKVELTGIPRGDVPQELLAEVEYADANGEILTAATRVPLWSSRLVLGIKPDSWAVTKEKLKFQVMALDLNGQPSPKAAIRVDLFQRLTFSHRKRLVGGFYGYQSGVEIKRLQTVCEGATDDKGRLFCEAQSPVGGEVILQAEAKDGEGRSSVSQTSAWVAEKADWWFDVANDDRIDVIPERNRYEPGENAVLQVRMPFREATALVTVEREGVVEAFVRPLSGKAPVVEVPIKGNYAPNVFVSVFVVRGRVAGIQPTALVDLGKPAFKMGVAELQVGWKAHEMKVSVLTDRQVYKAREKVRVEVEAKRALNGKPAKGAEVVLVAVDEGLLELAPNESWKLLEAMMQRRGIEVDTATASMQVVGKRHYGRKTLPPGGGGGRKSSRELFDTLLFWKARVKLDAEGRASAEVPLNDSLTSFRIVAVASAEAGLFGTGEASVRSTQDLQLLSGLPPLVREQDRFQARFTVRNASEQEMETVVSGKWTAQPDKGADLNPVSVKLAPGEAKDVTWDMKVPVGVETVRWEIAAKSGDQSDRLKVAQKVISAVPVRTFQATIAQLEGPYTLPVQIPVDAIPGRGGVRVTLQRSLSGELAGVREFMGAYPYTCLEQRVSQAVALRDEQRWRRIESELPSYLDRDGLAKYFHTDRLGSEVLTTYVLQIANEAGWELPDGSRERMEIGLIGFVEGRIQRYSDLPTADLSIRKIAALEAISRGHTVFKPEWLQSVAIEPNLWPTSAVIDWYSLLTLAKTIPERDKHLGQAEQILRSRLNFQGTVMGFSTERNDYLWWLMAHGDVNANRVLLSFLTRDTWKEDVPRLVRGTLGRQQRGHWSTTVANAWGVLAVEKFSRNFEQDEVTGATAVELSEQKQEHRWVENQPGDALMFSWPKGKENITVSHQGGGRPWMTLQSLAAIPLKEAFSSGFKINRSIASVERKDNARWSRGDVMRVRLDLESQSDMTWVVVRDPIPAGAALLGTGLGRDSRILASNEKKVGWVWPAFEERTFDSFRAYYRFVPKGKWTLEYTLRLNNPGEFHLPETRVEAMYAPEMFAEIPNDSLNVAP